MDGARGRRRAETVRRAGRAVRRADSVGGGPSLALGEGARVQAWRLSWERLQVGASRDVCRPGGRARREGGTVARG